MSGGKIRFEHDWGGAKVSVDKMADGLGQARIDRFYEDVLLPQRPA